jgi:hypothetical protein
LEAVGRLVNELAIGLDRRLARRKSQMPKGGPRRKVEKNILIRRLWQFWTQRLGRKATGTPGGPFVGFVNAVFRELGWGEDNERRVQGVLKMVQPSGSSS